MRRLIAVMGLSVILGHQAVASPQAGDPEAGKVVFNRCALCHSSEPGRTKVGPSLFGVVGRTSGTLPGYSYSSAMKDYNKVWTPDALNIYLTAPTKVVPGIKMTFAGISNDTDRANVIAYLQTLK